MGLGLVLALLSATLEGQSGVVAAPAPPVPAAVSTPCGPGWATAWMAAPLAAPRDPALDGATLRLVVHPTLAGSRIRIRLSNAFGREPLPVGGVSVARSGHAGGADLVADTLRPVDFSGRRRIVIPAGQEVLSDPVPLHAEAGQAVVVSIHLPVGPQVLTTHPAALQTSYLAGGGDFTLTPSGRPFDRTIGSWPVLAGLDVLSPHAENALLAVGDSITDGIGTAPDTAGRITDGLAQRLAAAGGTAPMAVLNAGIAGNQLLAGDPDLGRSALARLDRELAATAGVTDVLVHIGTNDIAAGRPAREITDGLRRYAERAHADGKRVFLTTITPSTSGAHGTPGAAAVRDEVNAWIRTSGPEHADGLFDFAAAVADPRAPGRLAAGFDSGDGLHLSAAGYRALAAVVEVDALTGSPCLAVDPNRSVDVVAQR